MPYIIAVSFCIIALAILLSFLLPDIRYLITACRSGSCRAVVREPLESVLTAAYVTSCKRKYQAYLVDVPSEDLRGVRAVYKPGYLAGGTFMVRVSDQGVMDFPRIQRTKEILIGGGLGVLFGLACVYMKAEDII